MNCILCKKWHSAHTRSQGRPANQSHSTLGINTLVSEYGTDHIFLRPANEVWGKVIFSEACVKNFVRGGAWLLGGRAWLPGGMRGCWGGMRGRWGACVVAGGHAWLPRGGCIGYDEIRSMSGRYASYWNAFLLLFIFWQLKNPNRNL